MIIRRKTTFSIWFFTIAIVAIGLVALYSASYHNSRVSHQVFYNQMYFAGVGFVLMWLIGRMDYRRFYEVAYIVYWVCVILLILVLVGGRHALGAQRWLSVAGISFQPSELAKLGLILALGRYFSEHRPTGFGTVYGLLPVLWRDMLLPLLMTLFPMLLIFKQPDLGTSLLFMGIYLVMLFVSGIRYRYFLSFLVLCCAVVPFGWGVLKPYQKDRLLVFLNPNIDPLGAGYTIIQSKIAIGSGQVFGKGWLAGTQNQLNFLPERHTDFIFSVIGEEWGLMGTVALILCYLFLILCGLRVAEQIKDRFGVQVCIGVVTILTLQVVINIGMVMGLLPVVGLTLPFISYGRTSFFIFIIMIGFLLSLSKRRTVF